MFRWIARREAASSRVGRDGRTLRRAPDATGSGTVRAWCDVLDVSFEVGEEVTLVHSETGESSVIRVTGVKGTVVRYVMVTGVQLSAAGVRTGEAGPSSSDTEPGRRPK